MYINNSLISVENRLQSAVKTNTGAAEFKKCMNEFQGVLGGRITENVLPCLENKQLTYLDRSWMQNELVKRPYQSESKILNAFFRFFQYIIEKLKYLFVFLFSGKKIPNFDYEILSQVLRALPQQGKCPLSVLLDYGYLQMKRQNAIAADGVLRQNALLTSDPELEIEKRLAFAAQLAKSLEGLQAKKNLSPQSKDLLKYIQEISGKIKNLKMNHKLLIPGGWRQAGEFQEALYEIEKTDNNQFTLRVLSLNPHLKNFWAGEKDLETEKIKYAPVLEFKGITIEQLTQSLEPLVHVQLPQLYLQSQKGQLGWFAKRLETVERMFAGTNVSKNSEINGLDLMIYYYQKKPEPSQRLVKISTEQAPQFFKVILAYLKTHDPDHYKTRKLELEILTFFQVIRKNFNAFLNQSALRDLVQASARKLIYELNKDSLRDLLSEERQQVILKDLQDMIQLAQTLDKANRRVALPDSFQFSAFNENFDLPSLNPPSKFVALAAQQASLEQVEFPKLDIPLNVNSIDVNSFLQTLKGQIHSIRCCYTSKDFATMEVLLLDLIRQLPSPSADADDLWQVISQHDLNAKECADHVFELSQCLLECLLAQGQCASPEKVIMQAHLLAIADRLMVLKAQSPINDFRLDIAYFFKQPIIFFNPDAIKKVFQNDLYFRGILAANHKIAEDTLNYWKEVEVSTPRARIELKNIDFFNYGVDLSQTNHKNFAAIKAEAHIQNPQLRNYLDHCAGHEIAYLTKMLLKKNQEEYIFAFKEIEVQKDSLLPSEVIQQRKMHFFMEVMLSQNHLLTLDSELELAQAGNRMVAEAGSHLENLSQKELWQRIFEIQDEKVRQKLLKNLPDVDKQTQLRKHIHWSMADQGKFKLDKLDVVFNPWGYNEWLKWHSNQEFYKNFGKPLDEEVDRSLVQFEMGIKNDGDKILTQQALIQRASSEEEKWLRSIQTGESRLEQTFALFSEHPDLLDRVSYQRLFELNFFQQGRLFQKLHAQPEFAIELFDFIQNNIQIAMGSGNILRALFFIRLRENIRDYIRLADLSQKHNFLDLFPAEVNDFTLLLQKAENNQERRMIYSYQLDFYSRQSSSPKKAAVLEEIIKGYFLLKSLPPGFNDRDSDIDQQADYLMIRLRSEIEAHLKNQNHLKAIVGQLFVLFNFPKLDRSLKGIFPVYKIEDYTIDFRKGLIFNRGQTSGILPIKILHNEWVKQLFNDKKTGQFTLTGPIALEYKLDWQTKSQVAIYSFKERPDIRFIVAEANELIIQMKMVACPKSLWPSKSWFELVPYKHCKESDTSLSLPHELADLMLDGFLWRNVSQANHLIITDKNSRKHLYEVKLSRQNEHWSFKQVKRFQDGSFLLNPWQEQKEWGSLTGIECHSHILAWGLNSEIKQFEFPRFKMPNGESLSYHVKKQGNSSYLFSDQSKGFILPYKMSSIQSFISGNEMSEEVLPHLFNGFQLLIHPKTKAKKVLIPLQPFQEAENGFRFSHWLDQAQLDHQPGLSRLQQVLEFEYDPIKKMLRSENKMANLFLAYLFFAHKRYQKAFEYLKLGETSLPLLSQHQPIYYWISSWKDSGPEATAFKLRSALALLINQNKQKIVPIVPEQKLLQLDRLVKLYTTYQKQKNSLSSVEELGPIEEEFYHRMIDQTFLPIIKNKPLVESKVAIPPLEWPNKPFFDLTQRIEPNALANLLFIKMKGKIKKGSGFVLTSDDIYIEGFRGLYEEIYAANLNSTPYLALKYSVETAQPQSAQAQAAHLLIKGLIKIKENLIFPRDLTEWEKYLFPINFSQPFSFLRASVIASGSSESLNQFKTLIERLDIFIQKEGSAQKVGVMANPTLPEREREIKMDALRIPMTMREGVHLFQTKLALEKQPEGILQDPLKVIQTLRHMQKLEQLARDRRVSELIHQRNLLNLYLTQNPPQKQFEESSFISPAAQEILEIGKLLKPFFELITFVPSTKELNDQKAKTTQFFDQCMDPLSGFPASAQRLAKKYREDTIFFIENQKIQDILAQPKAKIDELKSLLAEKAHVVTCARMKVEQEILALITPPFSNQVHPKSVLAPKLKSVPQRLIGLYTDRNVAAVNSLLGLNLDLEQLAQLELFIEKWMVLTIQERINLKAVEQIKDHASLEELSNEELHSLYQLLHTKRYFALHDGEGHARDLLTIEFTAGFVLREDQVQMIPSLLPIPKQVTQFRMAGGKTTVGYPIILNRLANGLHMALGIIPEWLYAIMAGDLDKSMSAIFGKNIYRFEFDRNTHMDIEWLLHNFVMMASAIKNKQVVITTKTFLLSFRAKFSETLAELEEADQSEQLLICEKLTYMTDILSLFRTRTTALADEIDSILDVRQELIYALGIPGKIAPPKWQMGLKIYEKILNWSKSDCAKLREYACKLRQNEQALLTASQLESIRIKIAEEFFDEWQERLGGVERGLFIRYMIQNDDSALPLINGMPYFMQRLKATPATLEFYQSLSALRQFLIHTLSTTFSHSGNVHYGRASDGQNTIPYKANNTPSEAEFGEDFERIGHFIQEYIQKGLSMRQIQLWISELMNKINAEMYAQMTASGKVGTLESTQTFKAFTQEFPAVDLTRLNRDPAMLQDFMKQLNATDDKKLNFLKSWIFPTLEMADLQVCTHSFDLVDMMMSFGGFTGSPWNVDTYNSKIQTQQAHTKGTDGKSIVLLLQMYAKGNLGIQTIVLDPKNPVQSILAAHPQFMDRYDSIIDAGYYLKGIENKDVVEQLGRQKSKTKQAVVYITTGNEKVIQTFGKDEVQLLQDRPDVKMEERISYYDQAHTIGTDLSHSPTARAAVTISEKMFIKDFLQACWRLRQLDKGQMIDVILTPDVRNLIQAARSKTHPKLNSETITIEDILLFCIKNQAEREVEDNLKAERQKIEGIVPANMFWQLVEVFKGGSEISLLFSHFIQKHVPKLELFKVYKQFLFKRNSHDYDALARVALSEDTRQVLNQLREHLVETFQNVKENLQISIKTDYFKQKLAEGIGQLKAHPILEADKLPEKTEGAVLAAKNTQVQTQRQQQQQVCVEVKATHLAVDGREEWQPWTAPTLQELWNTIEQLPKANPAIFFLDPRTVVTPNFMPAYQGPTSNIEQFLTHAKRIPAAQVLVIKNKLTQEKRLLLLDVKDYEEVVAKVVQCSIDCRFEAAVYDIRPQKGSLLLRSTAAYHRRPWQNEDQEEITQMLVKIKVLNQQINFYNYADVNALENWLQKDRARVKAYFESNLLTPSLQGAYPNSTLAKLLNA